MIYNTYLYLFFSFLALFILFYLFLNFKPNKNNINNKLLLKNLLESFDLELPDELKQLENSSTDTQKLS
mgnify:CR=1 FL=1